MTYKYLTLITPHGDRELAHNAEPVAQGQHLITPHGDRELVGMLVTFRLGKHSLPLMGIGNIGGPMTFLLVSSSHYPSWGSGTLGCGCTCKVQKSSLPLMGIGNLPERAVDRRYRRNLITPHGDREPSRTSCRSTISAQSHYPSWGSGTARALRALRFTYRDSLPLMGIGNFCVSPVCTSPRVRLGGVLSHAWETLPHVQKVQKWPGVFAHAWGHPGLG